MWVEIDLESFAVVHQGFRVKNPGSLAIFTSGELGGLQRIEDLAKGEYGQAVIVDSTARRVRFGRDYLGHFPLSYACEKGSLFISDDVQLLRAALLRIGVQPSVSEESVALYFSLGYVPHGMSPYREIVNCAATGFYEWSRGRVRRTRLFRPVEIDASARVESVGEAIEAAVARDTASDEVDVWCSGGLDSSIMAVRCNAEGRRAELLTLAYGEEIHEQLGDGERRFAREVAVSRGARLREVDLSCRKFEQVHEVFVARHNTPVIDTPLPPKYALAEASRPVVITGEGGDNFFGGPKNTLVMYAHSRSPDTPLGVLYARAHNRFVERLGSIFRRGDALTAHAYDYCNGLVASYPGDLLRKLFYLNSLEKPAGMIFAQSYFPSRMFGLEVRHPIAALGVYEAAFRLADHHKFVYPTSKIALTELYGSQLPESIVRRRKSGTQVPLRHYLANASPAKLDFATLAQTGLFRDEILDLAADPATREAQPLFVYAFVTLNAWLNSGKDTDHAMRLPPQARHHHEPRASLVV